MKKFTPYNVFIKWPKIILRNYTEKALRIYGKPIVLTDIYDIRFVFYPWDTTPLEKQLHRNHYQEEFEILEKLVKRDHTVFDIGANIGIHTTLFSRWAGPHGRVYAFEPVLDTYWQMRETTTLNRCFNLFPHQKAILDTPGSTEINVFDQKHSVWNTFGSHTFKGIKPLRKERVTVDTIDNFCKEHSINHINFAKIDVEGFEKKVLAGAHEMLSQKKIDCFSFEISAIPLSGSNTSAKEIFDMIISYGYTIYRYEPKEKKFVGHVKDSDEFYTNYYASIKDLTHA